MTYQFEHEEIKRCRECPCHSWADFPDEKDWCDLQDKQLAYDTEPEDNDCPLVAISKTETTSAKKIVVDIQLRPMLDELEVDIDDIKAYISKLD